MFSRTALISLLMHVAGMAQATDLTPIKALTDTMATCAYIVDQINAERVPANHAGYRLAKKSFAVLTDPTQRPPSDPAQDAYVRFMEAKALAFDACGKNYRMQLSAAWPLIQQLQESGTASGGPDNQIVPVVEKLREGSERLAKAIAVLSVEKQAESYVMRSLLEHFMRGAD